MFVVQASRILATALLCGLVLGGCSSSDGGSTGGYDGQITIENFESELQEYAITITNGAIIHEDGLQGGTIDLDRVLIGKSTFSTGGESLALGYSLRLASAAPSGAFAALYLDTDNNAQTGESIAGIGADQMFFDGHVFNNNITDFFDEYYFWTGTEWSGQTNGSSASYYQGTRLKRAVITARSSTIAANLFGVQNIQAVMVVRSYLNANPNTPGSIIDSTSVFTFDMPQ